jgi:hypothetical protein
MEVYLRALVGVVDHALWSPHRERHVQGVEHHPGGEGRSHRPAVDPTVVRIEHDRYCRSPFPNSSGSRAMLTAMRLATSAVNTFACRASSSFSRA